MIGEKTKKGKGKLGWNIRQWGPERNDWVLFCTECVRIVCDERDYDPEVFPGRKRGELLGKKVFAKPMMRRSLKGLFFQPCQVIKGKYRAVAGKMRS